ncbi:MAG: hypothetical protein ACR2MB_07240 [Acidimicrobiales bacterium]
MVAMATCMVVTACQPQAVQARWDAEGLTVGRRISVADPGPVPDTVGGHDLTMRSDATAAVTVVGGAPGQGVALAFPESGYTALTAAQSSTLSPHDRDIEVSAWVSIDAADIGQGSNVMQQGTYYQDEWKLELDGGRAGCRFADGDVRSGAHQASVQSSVRVDDGAWWMVTCRKTATQVTVVAERVGGSGPQVRSAASQVGSIDSTEPVMVGSKGIPSDPDQFRGRADNIDVRFP